MHVEITLAVLRWLAAEMERQHGALFAAFYWREITSRLQAMAASDPSPSA